MQRYCRLLKKRNLTLQPYSGRWSLPFNDAITRIAHFCINFPHSIKLEPCQRKSHTWLSHFFSSVPLFPWPNCLASCVILVEHSEEVAVPAVKPTASNIATSLKIPLLYRSGILIPAVIINWIPRSAIIPGNFQYQLITFISAMMGHHQNRFCIRPI